MISPETTKFRMACQSWDEDQKWEALPLSDDTEIPDNFILAGQGRDSSLLTIEERKELFKIFTFRKLSKLKRKRMEQLLSKVGFNKYIGIIDIDINIDSSDFNTETSRKKALTYAQQLSNSLHSYGLGNPNWFSVSYLGGFHAELKAPSDISDPYLLLAVLHMVDTCVDSLKIPRLLKFSKDARKDRSKRTDVYIDDSVLSRRPEARGSLWRIPGTSKPDGKKKTLIDIFDPLCPEIESTKNHSLIDKDALLNVLCEVKRLKALETAETESESRPVNIDITEIPGKELSEADKVFLQNHNELLEIWHNSTKSDRSLRDFDFVRHCIYFNADDNQAYRLLYSMPRSKLRQDRRGIGYLDSILRKVRSYKPPNLSYRGHLKPLRLTQDDRSVIYKALSLSNNIRILKNLNATLKCGEPVITKDDEVTDTIYRCERPTCPYCELRRAFIQFEAASKNWPKTIALLDFKLTSSSVTAPQEAFLNFKKSLSKSVKKTLLPYILTFRAPGELLIVSPNSVTASSLPNAKIVPKAECLEEIKRVYYLRFNRLFSHLKNNSPSRLACDPWAGKVVSVKGGRKSGKYLPWLSKEELRKDAKLRAEIVRNTTNETAKPSPTINLDHNTECLVTVGISESGINLNKNSKLDDFYQKPPD